MAKKIEDPKTLAAKIAKTKAMAGDREVTVNKTPSAGFPGSGRPMMMKEVKVVAQAPSNQTMGKKISKVQGIAVGQLGGKKVNFGKEEVISALKSSGFTKEADALKSFTTIAGNELADVVNKVIKLKKIKPLM